MKIQDDSQPDVWWVGDVMHQDDGDPEEIPADKIGAQSPHHVDCDTSRV